MIGHRNQVKHAEKTQIDQANYLTDAIRFNVFSLAKQQAEKRPLICSCLFFMNLIAIIFESFLHLNMGRDYASPFRFIFGSLKELLIFLVRGGLGLLFVLLFLFYVMEQTTSSKLFSQTLAHGADLFTSPALGIFFVAGFTAMTLQAFVALASFKKTQRFSQSNGTPWLFYLTRIPFFKSLIYIIYIEPLIVIFTSSALFLVLGLSSAKYFIFLGVIYLLRNIYVHSLIDSGMVKRSDMDVQSNVEQASQNKQQKPLNSEAQTAKPPARSDELKDFIE